jgi:hypothetical protein
MAVMAMASQQTIRWNRNGDALLEMILTTRRIVEHFDRPSATSNRQMLETIS